MAHNNTFSQPKSQDFDFSGLNQSMADIRNGFWNLKKHKDKLKKELAQSHSHFFNKIISDKRDTQMQEIFKQSMQLDSGYQKMVRLKIQKKRKAEQAVEDEENKKKFEQSVRVYQDPSDTTKLEQSRNQQLNSQNSQNLALSNDSRIQETRKKIANSIASIFQQKKNQILQKQPSISIALKRNSISPQKQIQFQINQLIQKFKNQLEKVMQTSKQANIVPSKYSDSSDLDMSTEDWVQLLQKTDLSYMSYQQFKILLASELIMTPIARELQYLHGVGKFTRDDLEDTLSRCDKDLYVLFREKKITFDQLKARVAERQGIATYKVFDDIKDQLHPSILQNLEKYDDTMKLLFKGKQKIEIQDLLRPLEAWEINQRCLKSIQYVHNKRKNKSNPRITQKNMKEIDLILSQNNSQLHQQQQQRDFSMPSIKNNEAAKLSETQVKLKPNHSEEKQSKVVQQVLVNLKKTGQQRVKEQFTKLQAKHQTYIRSQVNFYSNRNEQNAPKTRNDYGHFQIEQNQKIDLKEQEKLHSPLKLKSIQQQQRAYEYLNKEQKELLEAKRKQGLLFLKQLEVSGQNLNVSESQKKLLGISDDLENAMKLDMLSDEDLGGDEDNKKVLTDKEKKERFLKQLKQSCIKAKNVTLFDNKRQSRASIEALWKNKQQQQYKHNQSLHKSSYQDQSYNNQNTDIYTPMSTQSQTYLMASPNIPGQTFTHTYLDSGASASVNPDIMYNSYYNPTPMKNDDKLEVFVQRLKHRVALKNRNRAKSDQLQKSHDKFNETKVSGSFQEFVNYYGIPVAKQLNYN